jgi:hypothetical protein
MMADSLVDHLGDCQQAHALEALARSVAGPDFTALLPESFAAETIVALAHRPGTRILFEAASRVCAPHLVARMQQLAAEREAAGDRSSKLVSLVGELTVDLLFRVDSEGSEDACVVLLTRPKQKHPQLLLIARDRRLPGAPLRLGTLTAPLSSRRIEQLLAAMRADREVPVPAPAGDFEPWLVEGAKASAELGLAPTADGVEVAVQLLRQRGEPELADQLSLLYPLELDYEESGSELDQELYDELKDEVDAMVEEFGDWLAEHAPALDDAGISLASQDAGLALEFRLDVLGAEVDDPWSDEELDVFLLSWVPANVMTNDEDRVRMPVSMEYLFRFLGERDMLPPAAEKLARRAVALSDAFAQRASDPTRRGPSGALLEAMLDEGVDLSDPAAVEAWMTGFNERPLAERDAILGMSLPSLPAPGDD